MQKFSPKWIWRAYESKDELRLTAVADFTYRGRRPVQTRISFARCFETFGPMGQLINVTMEKPSLSIHWEGSCFPVSAPGGEAVTTLSRSKHREKGRISQGCCLAECIPLPRLGRVMGLPRSGARRPPPNEDRLALTPNSRSPYCSSSRTVHAGTAAPRSRLHQRRR